MERLLYKRIQLNFSEMVISYVLKGHIPFGVCGASFSESFVN